MWAVCKGIEAHIDRFLFSFNAGIEPKACADLVWLALKSGSAAKQSVRAHAFHSLPRLILLSALILSLFLLFIMREND